jgi:CelD/BcsL family acetyltransferase involved in cellulose biosynthesis
MQTRTATDTDDFAALRDGWTGLLSRSPWRHVFLSHEFASSWWNNIAANSKLSIVAVQDESTVVALAPLMLTRARFARFPIRRLELIGAHWGYGGILYDPRQPDALNTLLDELAARDEWHILELPKLLHPPEDLASRLTEAFPSSKFLHQIIDASIPYVSLQTSWEQYLQERSPRFRRNLRNRLRKLEQLGSPRFLHVEKGSQPGLEPPQILEHLAEIASRSWKASAGTAINSTPQLLGYYSELLERLYDAGFLRVCILLVDEKPAAYVLGALFNGEFMEIDIAYDESLSSCSPGTLVKLHLIESYCGRDLARYDFVETQEHKLDLTSQLHETQTHVIFRRSAYMTFLRSLRNVLSR